MQNEPLSQASQAILNEMTAYHADRLHHFQDRASRRSRARHMDGEYSLTRLLNAQRDDRVRQQAPYELAVSDRIAEEFGERAKPGFAYVPYERPLHTRDLTTAVTSAGGALVATTVGPGDLFIGALLASLPEARMGMPIIGLKGNAIIPRVSGTITTYWLSTEATEITESQLEFAIATATPKNVGAYCEVSGQLLKQTSEAAQRFVWNETGRAVGAAVDSAIVSGTGLAGQPLGILGTTGIGSVAGAAITWPGVLDIIYEVENANALVDPRRGGWLMPPAIAKILHGRERAAGSGFIIDDNRMAGYPAAATNSVPADTILFGDWSGVALLEWGALQIGTDPYGVNSTLFRSGLVGLRAIWSIDVVVLRPASFAQGTEVS